MKLAFSTIACPRWNFDEIFSTAVDFRFDGIEIRGISNEMYAPSIAAFSEENLAATKKRLADSGVEISCLTSGACLAMNVDAEKSLAEGKAYLDLAGKLGVKYVRFMPTGVPHLDGGDEELCRRLFTELCVYGEERGVTPLMETNGMFADTKRLKVFMESVKSNNKAVLWDVNHPYRFNGESVEVTVSNIGQYVGYVHVKDSIAENGGTTYKLLGYGDVPVKEAVDVLKSIGYSGYLSLEWVKRWNKNLEEPFVVIPNYAGYMKNLIK